MKLTLKILKLFAILLITVLIILFSASFLLQDKVADIILTSLNKNISTKLDVGSFKFSFLRKFPYASLELKEVLVHSSSGFDSEKFTAINTDTLLSAKTMFIEFKIRDILKGNYNIERISTRAGKMNFFIDTDGQVNYNISANKDTSEINDFTLNLERINLIDIRTSYTNLATRLDINGVIKNGKFKSRISGYDIDFTASVKMQIDSFQLFNTKIIKTITTELDVNLQGSKGHILFKEGTLQIENFDFGLSGSITSEKMVDLNVSGNNIDISKVSNYLPEKYFKLVAQYDPSGILLVDGKIKGLLSRTSNPHVEISCLLNEGHIVYGKSDLTIDDLSFAGFYSNGSENLPETSFISIKEITAKLGSAQYSGSFTLSEFDHPITELTIKGRVFPEELKEYFNLKKISNTGGYVDLDLNLVNFLNHKGKYTISDIIDLKPEATLAFNSFSIGLNNDKTVFHDIDGNLSVSSIISANDLQLTYEGQRIKIDGDFINLPEWLTGRYVMLTANADVSFDRLIPEVFLKDTLAAKSQDSDKTAFTLPGDILLNINFTVDTLRYKTFSSSEITGVLNYKPRLLTFTSLNMKSLNGIISGNGFIVQEGNKSVIARGNFNVTNIDVNEAFFTFRNFGQDFLKAENLAGTLSGSLSLLLPMDSLLNPKLKSLTAEGKFHIADGALMNFEPVKQLSSFIELSELENISFRQLENDFFIRDNYLYIPQMDVNSSAVDLTVNGRHGFDNRYEYHVKMLLSEILSRKRKNNRSNLSEFGVIEDDGLGRTSLLLKIENKGEEVKVGYDIKAMGSEIKNNIKSERQTLKTILNQEYGWFKDDSTLQQELPEKSRFRITFGETDSIIDTPEPPAEKKESVLKNLFKKK